MNYAFWILTAITTIIFIITAIQDIRNPKNVASYLFAIIPLVRFIPALIAGEHIYWVSHLLGLSLALLFLIYAIFGKCGGADVIMAACVGFAFGFKDASIFLCAACILYVIQIICFTIIKKIPIKDATRTSMPFIPASACGFVCMIIINHIILL